MLADRSQLMNRKAGRRLCLLLGVVFLVEAAGKACSEAGSLMPIEACGRCTRYLFATNGSAHTAHQLCESAASAWY